jgi:hypothetical protein
MPAAAYDQAAHFAAEQRATVPGITYVYFFYPPVFLLICAALARLPYLVAFAAFEGTTLLACLAATRRIVGRVGAKVYLPMLAFPAIFINIGVGQNALLTGALFAWATWLIDRRPAIAGALLGAVCYKPHYGLLIPVALAAGRRWRAFAAAAASVALLVGLSAALFGLNTWAGFFEALTGSHTTYESGKVDFAAFVNLFGVLRLFGAAPALAYALQCVMMLAMALSVGIVWRRNLPLPLRAAMLLAATVAATPLSLFYDLILVGVAAAWLVRDGLADGFIPWEKTTLAIVFVVPLLTRGFGTAWHLPLAALTPLAVVALCAVIARRRLAATQKCAGEVTNPI